MKATLKTPSMKPLRTNVIQIANLMIPRIHSIAVTCHGFIGDSFQSRRFPFPAIGGAFRDLRQTEILPPAMMSATMIWRTTTSTRMITTHGSRGSQ